MSMNHRELRNAARYTHVSIMASHAALVLRADPASDVSEAVVGILRATGVTATPEMLVFARDRYVRKLTAIKMRDEQPLGEGVIIRPFRSGTAPIKVKPSGYLKGGA